MKILVSRMPKETVECPFSKFWSQSTPPYYKCIADKHHQYCYGPDKCNVLEEIKQPKVAFICDRKACEKCSYPMCQYTTDASHALNFLNRGGGIYFEDLIVVKEQSKTVSKVKEYLSDEEILCQLAEEASELAQAALKYRRVLNGTNPTPVSEKTALLNLREEVADVSVCLDLLFDQSDRDAVEKMAEIKSKRWVKHLEEKRVDQKEDDTACHTSTK